MASVLNCRAGTHVERPAFVFQTGIVSRTVKLSNRIEEQPTSADMPLMFILGITVGAAVPLLVMAVG
jgi:hypothetical protein